MQPITLTSRNISDITSESEVTVTRRENRKKRKATLDVLNQ